MLAPGRLLHRRLGVLLLQRRRKRSLQPFHSSPKSRLGSHAHAFMQDIVRRINGATAGQHHGRVIDQRRIFGEQLHAVAKHLEQAGRGLGGRRLHDLKVKSVNLGQRRRLRARLVQKPQEGGGLDGAQARLG